MPLRRLPGPHGLKPCPPRVRSRFEAARHRLGPHGLKPCPPRGHRRFEAARHRLACWLLALAAWPSLAQGLPPEVDAALARAKLPRDALSLWVAEADGGAPPRLSHRAGVPVNPASIAKLVTTFAGLDLLGPSFTWSTPVYVEGAVQGGTLHGNLYIKGQGDPKLVAERLWLLLRRVQGLGIRSIAGDIVLDRSAFETPPVDPGAFDGEPLRPYNAAPDALLLNFKALVMAFTPQGGQAQVHVEPALAGVQWPAAVPLSGGECGDWRGALKADFSDPARIRFAGSYPSACAERVWPIAYTVVLRSDSSRQLSSNRPASSGSTSPTGCLWRHTCALHHRNHVSAHVR